MATVTLSHRYAGLDDWPGRLFEADATTTVLTRGATTFSVRHGAGSEFEGYRVVATGTGFVYQGGVAIAGLMQQVRVFDAAGAVVLTIGNLGPVSNMANNLGQFAFDMFGSGMPGVGPQPDGKAAWAHLLTFNDRVIGTAGDDVRGLVGIDRGDDVYVMNAGRDLVHGGQGNDSIDGGAGVDTLSFAETHFNEGNTAFRGVAIDVQAGTAIDAWGGRDRFVGVESFVGSAFADTFAGSLTQADNFAGLRGLDGYDGGADSLTATGLLDYADLRDQISYRDDWEYGGRFGIVANLEVRVVGTSIEGSVRDGFGQIEAVREIERVEGTRFGDLFIGSRADNRFRGGEGRDTYRGAAGIDEIDFSVSFGDVQGTGVNVNLSRTGGDILNDGFGNVESAYGIEDIVGTDLGDRIIGNGANNVIQGMDGADILDGRGGADTFVWTRQAQIGDEDRILNFQSVDRLSFNTANFVGMDETLRLVIGSAAPTAEGTFIFNPDTDRLIWDSNGSVAGGQALVALITSVDTLAASNFVLWD